MIRNASTLFPVKSRKKLGTKKSQNFNVCCPSSPSRQEQDHKEQGWGLDKKKKSAGPGSGPENMAPKGFGRSANRSVKPKEKSQIILSHTSYEITQKRKRNFFLIVKLKERKISKLYLIWYLLLWKYSYLPENKIMCLSSLGGPVENVEFGSLSLKSSQPHRRTSEEKKTSASNIKVQNSWAGTRPPFSHVISWSVQQQPKKSHMVLCLAKIVQLEKDTVSRKLALWNLPLFRSKGGVIIIKRRVDFCV